MEVGRGSSDATCPVIAVETWIQFAKLAKGPLFRRVTGEGKDVGPDRLNDKEVARLVKSAALAAGVRGDLSEGERALKFSGHSLRASSAEVDECRPEAARPRQCGNDPQVSARRDRFRINLTKPADFEGRLPCPGDCFPIGAFAPSDVEHGCRP